MTVSRWIAIAALGCLLIAVAYLPPALRQDQYNARSLTSTEEARLDLINRARQRTEEFLTEVRLRDSVRALLRANTARLAGAALAVTGSVPAQRVQTIQGAVDKIWRDAHGVDGSRLLVLLDARPKLRRYTVEYILPQTLDHHTCVVGITVDPTLEWMRANSVLGAPDLEPTLRESLGPCLYYAAFGEPGSYVARWLEQRSYKVANSGDWTNTPDVARRWEDPAVWNVLVSNLPFNAVACIAGRTAQCRQVIADSTDESPFFRAPPPPSRITGVVRRIRWGSALPGEDYFLATLIREKGRDRFAQFWRSPAPIDSAFRSAFGQPIEQWTAAWTRQMVPPLPPFGPAPRPVSIVLAMIAAGAVVTVAAAAVMRRQVR